MRNSSGTAKSLPSDSLQKKLAPFTRPVVDGDCLFGIQHRVANGARKLFGRPVQPSAMERQEQTEFLARRQAQLAALSRSSAAMQVQQVQQVHPPLVYEQIDHEATQAAVQAQWHQWRLNNLAVSHPVGNQAGVSMVYL